MCTGVIVITPVITICVVTMTAAPAYSADRGSVAAPDSATWTPSPAGAAASASATRRASRYGSGRSSSWKQIPAAPNATAASRNGPASTGMPSVFARSPSGVIRLGPATAPSVVAASETLIARPRRCGSARSVPA